MTILTISRKITVMASAVALIAALAPGSVFAAGDGPASPHWVKDKCEVCHENAAPTSGNMRLKADRAEQLCESCHGEQGDALSCRHVSDIPVGDTNIPGSYATAVEGGKLVCTSCHDLTVQCRSPNKAYSFMNPGFVRDRSSRDRGEACFQCHDASGFERLNPHMMKAGNPPQPTCTLCHESMPVKDANGWLAVDFNVTHSLSDMCTGCHKVKPHPGNSFSGEPIGWEHLGIPSQRIRDNMTLAEKTLGLVFPLDPNTGEMHCATCHNPHNEDLAGYPVAPAPGSRARLRVDEICQACHDL